MPYRRKTTGQTSGNYTPQPAAQNERINYAPVPQDINRVGSAMSGGLPTAMIQKIMQMAQGAPDVMSKIMSMLSRQGPGYMQQQTQVPEVSAFPEADLIVDRILKSKPPTLAWPGRL